MSVDSQDKTKRIRVYCSCGCDHLTMTIEGEEAVIIADSCGCPKSLQHVVMINKPENYRGDGVTLAKRRAM